MWYPAKLVMKSYKPLFIQKGMLFFSNGKLIELDLGAFPYPSALDMYGYPVEPYIIDPLTEEVLAEPHQIGWIDYTGEYLTELSVEDMNYILGECDGELEIEIEEEGSNVLPSFEEGLITVKIISPKENNEEIY